MLLAERLQLHSSEIRQTILDRLHAMAGDEGVKDIGYLRELEAAVSSGVEYALELAALGGAKVTPFPLPVLVQARAAARHRIPLKRVLRGYLAAKTILSDYVGKAAAKPPDLGASALRAAIAAHNAAFDQLVTTVSDEYEREESARCPTGKSQQADLIQRLLRAEPAEEGLLQYDFDCYHLGLVVLSPDAQPLLRSLSREVDARLLTTKASGSATWAWLGAIQPLDPMAICRWAERHWTAPAPFGIGEVAQSLSGWRRTHNQAQAAASVAQLTSQAVRRYRDVALISAVSRDPLLLASLHNMYLAPLAQDGDRGKVLRATLRAYFDANRNASCAAAGLGVSRQTLSKRVALAEGHLGQAIGNQGDLLHAALQLEECGAFRLLDNR